MKTTRLQRQNHKKRVHRKARLVPKDEAQTKPQAGIDELPLYCDFSCPKADFPPSDAVGACRREQAVWCGVLKRYNSKNGKCLVSST